ncbi:MAG: hypothetical protein KAT32_00465 [Candidatus Moranbacteria bacterium]|nr:hypothetical protein [Candidatus Moranbacteria bacterium]
MNNFGASNLENEIVVQELISKFIVGALSLVFVGSFLTGIVGIVIWVTSGGDEGRNDMSVGMMKSSLMGMLGAFLGYVAVRVFVNVLGIDL